MITSNNSNPKGIKFLPYPNSTRSRTPNSSHILQITNIHSLLLVSGYVNKKLNIYIYKVNSVNRNLHIFSLTNVDDFGGWMCKIDTFFFFSILHYLMQMLLRCVCIGYCKLCFEFKVSVCKKVMRSYYCEMEFLVLKTLFQTSKTLNRTDPWYVYKSAGAYMLF